MATTVELTTLIEYVDDYMDTSDNSRAVSERCRDYYDGNQWTAEEMQVLQNRKQPIVTNNRIQPMVDFLKGLELSARTDPKAFARTPKHEKDADAATDAIRFVQDAQKFDSISSEVFEEFLIEGPSGVNVGWDKKKKMVTIEMIHFNRLILDPHSRTKQMTDSGHSGVAIWMDGAEAKAKWPGSRQAIDEDLMKFKATRGGDTLDDVPRWYDTQRDRMMVVEMYFMHDEKWHHAVFTHGDFLEKPAVSAYKDQDGVPSNPHILASPKVDRDGGRYGLVATRLSMQDSINKRQSKATDLLNRRQTFAKKGSIDDVADFKKQVNDSGGHIEFPPGPGKFNEDFGVVPNESLAGPQFEMYRDDINQLEAVTKGSLAADNETNLSGKALKNLQLGRSMEIAPIREVYHQWLVRVSTAVWERIRQFWKEDKWIRVTDEEENVKFVGLNRNMTVRDQIIQQLGAVPPELKNNPDLDIEILDEQGKKVPMNKVSEIDVDIFMEEVPDILTLQQEIFEKLAEMWQSNPEAIPYEMIIEVSPLPARVKERILKPKEPSADELAQKQQQEQLQQAAAQIELAGKQARAQKDGAEAQKKGQEAQQTALENEMLKGVIEQGQPPTQVNI